MHPDSMKVPKVVVSILNWHSFSQTIACLDSLMDLSYPEWTICITDNHSPDFDEEYLRERYSSIQVFRNSENLGFAKGHAKALSYAQNQSAELLWLLNCDVRVFEDTLSELLDAYHKHGIGLYGSLALDETGKPQPDAIYRVNTAGKWPTDFLEIPLEALSSGQTLSVANVIGYSMLIPLTVIDRYGFLNDKYFLYYEETDYCLSLLKNGIPSIWVGSSRVFHEKQGSTKGSLSRLEVMDYYLYRNLFLFLKQHAPVKRTLHFLLRFTMRFLSANVLKKKKVPELTQKHLIGIWHGITGRSGKYYAPEDFS